MISLLSGLIGFIGAAFPDLLKLFRDGKDRAHELAILELQLAQAAQGHSERLEEIHTQADITESAALYKTYQTGVSWVDALNGTVRPVLAYCFFFLYALVKFHQMGMADAPVWDEEDQAIFAGITSFYFGQRAMSKLRK